MQSRTAPSTSAPSTHPCYSLGSDAGDRLVIDRQSDKAKALRFRVLQDRAGVGGFVAGLGMNGMQVVIAAVAADNERRRPVRGNILLDALVIVHMSGQYEIGNAAGVADRILE